MAWGTFGTAHILSLIFAIALNVALYFMHSESADHHPRHSFLLGNCLDHIQPCGVGFAARVSSLPSLLAQRDDPSPRGLHAEQGDLESDASLVARRGSCASSELFRGGGRDPRSRFLILFLPARI